MFVNNWSTDVPTEWKELLMFYPHKMGKWEWCGRMENAKFCSEIFSFSIGISVLPTTFVILFRLFRYERESNVNMCTLNGTLKYSSWAEEWWNDVNNNFMGGVSTFFEWEIISWIEYVYKTKRIDSLFGGRRDDNWLCNW